MTRVRAILFISILLFCWAALPGWSATAAGTEAPAAAPAQAPRIDPQAAELLRKMSDYLSTLSSFSVQTAAIQEVALPTGEILDSDRSTEMKVERPNHFRAQVVSALRNVEVIYDGKKVTMYSPGLNVYGQWEAPPTIQQTVAKAEEEYGLSVPMRDFLSPEARAALMSKVESGGYVGRSLINGTMAHHLAFRGKDVDWQLWIADGDKPLPVRVAITDRGVQGAPRFMVTLTDWNTAPQFEAATFTFTPPEGAKQVSVLSLTQIKKRQAEVQAQK